MFFRLPAWPANLNLILCFLQPLRLFPISGHEEETMDSPRKQIMNQFLSRQKSHVSLAFFSPRASSRFMISLFWNNFKHERKHTNQTEIFRSSRESKKTQYKRNSEVRTSSEVRSLSSYANLKRNLNKGPKIVYVLYCSTYSTISSNASLSLIDSRVEEA